MHSLMHGSGLRGALAAMGALFIWGLFSLFWSQLGDVPALQVLAHRAVWCAFALWGLLLVRGELGWVRQVRPRQLAFGCIRVALAVFTADALRRYWSTRVATG